MLGLTQRCLTSDTVPKDLLGPSNILFADGTCAVDWSNFLPPPPSPPPPPPLPLLPPTPGGLLSWLPVNEISDPCWGVGDNGFWTPRRRVWPLAREPIWRRTWSVFVFEIKLASPSDPNAPVPTGRWAPRSVGEYRNGKHRSVTASLKGWDGYFHPLPISLVLPLFSFSPLVIATALLPYWSLGRAPVCVCVCVCVCRARARAKVRVCVRVRKSVCVCQRERERQRQRETETERQSDRQTNMQSIHVYSTHI